MRKITSFLAVLLVLTVPAHAQTIVLSGDSGIASALNGSFGVPLNTGNQRFFQNVLGSGSKVIVQTSTLGQSATLTGNAEGVINSYYNGLPGVTSVEITGPVTPATLSGSNLFVSMLPDAAYLPTEISALQSFSSGGGTIFFLGDAAGFSFAQNAFINTDLTGLGSSMQLAQNSLDSNGVMTLGPTHIVGNALTTGVTSLTYGYVSQVTGGASLFTTTGNQPFAAVQILATPEPSSATDLAFSALGVACLILRNLMLRNRIRRCFREIVLGD